MACLVLAPMIDGTKRTYSRNDILEEVWQIYPSLLEDPDPVVILDQPVIELPERKLVGLQ